MSLILQCHKGKGDRDCCARIFKQSMGTRNRVGIGLSCRPARLHRLAALIPWKSIPGILKSLKIRALIISLNDCRNSELKKSGSDVVESMRHMARVMSRDSVVFLHQNKCLSHWLNMELDLHSLFGIHVHSCTHWMRPRNYPPPPHLGSYTRALLVSQDRLHPLCDPLVSRECLEQ